MRKQHRLRLLLGGVGAALFIFGLSPVGAASANLSHSYQSNGSIANGSLVSLDSQQTNYVVASNSDNGDQLLGVAVASNDSLLAVDADSGKVQVATSGTATVLVSTLNGSINVGDEISVSPFDGLGMKAEAGAHIIGLAQTGFNSNSSGATAKQVTDNSGHSSQIYVGYVRLSIGIGTANSDGGVKLNSLQRLGKSLTGHTISTTRVVISIVVAVVAFLALITLVYASIYGSIVSIGRNPLAKFAVFRTLGSVMGMALLTAGIAALTIFFLLH